MKSLAREELRILENGHKSRQNVERTARYGMVVVANALDHMWLTRWYQSLLPTPIMSNSLGPYNPSDGLGYTALVPADSYPHPRLLIISRQPINTSRIINIFAWSLDFTNDRGGADNVRCWRYAPG